MSKSISQGGKKNLEGLVSTTLMSFCVENEWNFRIWIWKNFSSVHHIKGLEVASSSYHKVLEENRLLYNQVQDLKGKFLEFSHLHKVYL